MTFLAAFTAAVYFTGITAALAVMFTPLSGMLAHKLGVVDVPGPRAIHKHPIPLLGGLAIAGALMAVVWFHLGGAAAWSDRPTAGALSRAVGEFHFNSEGFRIAIILAGGLVIAAVGFIDDAKGLTVRQRIYPQFAVACAVMGLAVQPRVSFLPDALTFVLGVVWLVGITNSFNLIDGADGLASGIAAIVSGLLGISMLLSGQFATACVLFCITGACLGFLAYNWHPARIFMGSTGSLFLGYLLGATAMLGTFLAPNETFLFPLLIPVFAFAVPLYDTASVILIRLGLKRSVFEGDKSHFHHRLMRIGFSHRQTVAFMYLLTFAFGTAAILISRNSLIPNLIILFQGAILVTVIILMERVVGRVKAPAPARDPLVQPLSSPGQIATA